MAFLGELFGDAARGAAGAAAKSALKGAERVDPATAHKFADKSLSRFSTNPELADRISKPETSTLYPSQSELKGGGGGLKRQNRVNPNSQWRAQRAALPPVQTSAPGLVRTASGSSRESGSPILDESNKLPFREQMKNTTMRTGGQTTNHQNFEDPAVAAAAEKLSRQSIRPLPPLPKTEVQAAPRPRALPTPPVKTDAAARPVESNVAPRPRALPQPPVAFPEARPLKTQRNEAVPASPPRQSVRDLGQSLQAQAAGRSAETFVAGPTINAQGIYHEVQAENSNLCGMYALNSVLQSSGKATMRPGQFEDALEDQRKSQFLDGTIGKQHLADMGAAYDAKSGNLAITNKKEFQFSEPIEIQQMAKQRLGVSPEIYGKNVDGSTGDIGQAGFSMERSNAMMMLNSSHWTSLIKDNNNDWHQVNSFDNQARRLDTGGPANGQQAYEAWRSQQEGRDAQAVVVF